MTYFVQMGVWELGRCGAESTSKLGSWELRRSRPFVLVSRGNPGRSQERSPVTGPKRIARHWTDQKKARNLRLLHKKTVKKRFLFFDRKRPGGVSIAFTEPSPAFQNKISMFTPHTQRRKTARPIPLVPYPLLAPRLPGHRHAFLRVGCLRLLPCVRSVFCGGRRSRRCRGRFHVKRPAGRLAPALGEMKESKMDLCSVGKWETT